MCDRGQGREHDRLLEADGVGLEECVYGIPVLSGVLVVGDVGGLGAALALALDRPDAVLSGYVQDIVPGAGALQDAAIDLELLRAEVEAVTAGDAANGPRSEGIGAHLLGRVRVVLALTHGEVRRATGGVIVPLVRADGEGGDLVGTRLGIH